MNPKFIDNRLLLMELIEENSAKEKEIAYKKKIIASKNKEIDSKAEK